MKIILICILIVSVIPGLCSSVDQRRFRRQAKACRDYEEFSCRAGKCISRYEVCDGVRNCPDGSDETAQACRQVSITSCPTTLFRCQYGACVSLSLRCDNKRDCPDGSDEFGCNNNVPHQQTSSVCNDEFSCRDGSCINTYLVCDGVRHCPDGSDETATACRQLSITSCPSWTFKCQYGACINSNLRCNGKANCVDDSDEIGCPSPSFNQQQSSFDQQQSTTAAPASVCKSAGDIQCDNGQCVSQYSMCDGVIDCGDRSDETEAACYRVFEGRCPAEQWRCAYGACLRQSTRCDGRQDCWDGSDEASCSPPFSPPTPAPFIPSTTNTASSERTCELPREAMNRHFMDYLGKLSLQPGQPVKDTGVVLVTCDPQYQLIPPQTYVVCNGGQWSHEFSKCAKLCPSLTAPTLDLTCRAGWQGLSMGCDKAMLPGTVVKFKCKEYYELTYFNQLDMILCDDSGQWSMPLPPCKPKCGISTLEVYNVPTITDGTISKLGNFPWFAGIYHRKDSRWDAACGGTLITPKFVLTAAHCVTSKSNVEALTLPESEIMVTLGKYYRDWNMHESSEYRVTIRKINIHPFYRGEPQSYREDIAVLELYTEMPISSFIMPACVDFTLQYAHQLTQNTEAGYIAGWGNTNDCGIHSTICDSRSLVLLHTRASFMSYDDCYKETQTINPSSHNTLTSDKYCVGNGSVSVVQSGDSGGGHTFVFGGLHYVFGVVSTKLKLERPDKRYSFAALTNVSYHINWLKEQLLH